MNRINQFGIEPGVWKHSGGKGTIVVSNIVTHLYSNGEMIELEDPQVVYRDLIINADKMVTYSMVLSEFKRKFTKD
jgi:hypothetical protein